jgi:hypothetical protein
MEDAFRRQERGIVGQIMSAGGKEADNFCLRLTSGFGLFKAVLLALLYNLRSGQPFADSSKGVPGSYPAELAADRCPRLGAARVCYVAVIISFEPSLLIGCCDEYDTLSP